MNAFIISTGSYLPERVVDNSDLKQFPANAIPLIEAKTGVKSRRYAGEGQFTSSLAAHAAKACLREFPPEKIDAILLATSTADRPIPAAAARVASEIGAKNCFAADLNSVCTGSVVAVELAAGLVKSGMAKNVLAIAADSYSKILDMSDFSTAPYFGDGAGCALVSSDPENAVARIGEAAIHTDGEGFDTITVRAGGSEIPFAAISNPKDAFFKMKGRAVFEFATDKGRAAIEECLAKNGADKAGVVKFILHQANVNIIKKIAGDLGADEGKFFTNLEKYANTAGASTLIALDDFLKGEESPAGNVVLAAFGGGLTWGAILLEKLK